MEIGVEIGTLMIKDRPSGGVCLGTGIIIKDGKRQL